MRMVYRNRNPAGLRMCLLYGLAELIDGVVRVLSLGFLATTLPMDASKLMAKRGLAKLRLKSKAAINQSER